VDFFLRGGHKRDLNLAVSKQNKLLARKLEKEKEPSAPAFDPHPQFPGDRPALLLEGLDKTPIPFQALPPTNRRPGPRPKNPTHQPGPCLCNSLSGALASG
jgi:hypothetical protein